MPKPVSDPIVWRAFFPSFLRDAGFLEDLERTAPTDEAWGALAAGYRVVRLMDWLRVSDETSEFRSLDELHHSLRASNHALCLAAADLLHVVVEWRGRRAHPGQVAATMFWYADELTTAFYHASARCVLGVLLESDSAPLEPSIAWRAMRLRGHLNQNEGHLDRAFDDFSACVAIGEAIADSEAVLRGRANIGMLAAHRGDFPSAEAIMRGLLVEARASEKKEVIGRISQNLGVILGFRGRFDESVQVLEESLDYVTGRDRATGYANLGLAKMLSGDAVGARVILEAIIRDAAWPNAEWVARSSLIEMDAIAGDRKAVEAHVAALDRPLPHHQAETKLSIGRAYKILGDSVKAAAWLGQALYDAERSGRGNFVFDIERELEELRRMRSAAPGPESIDHADVATLDERADRLKRAQTINGSPE